MVVTLNIQNDSELRSYVKDLIKGQLLAVTREELVHVVKEELERKVKGLNSANFERMLGAAMIVVVKQILYNEHKVSEWNTELIRPSIDNRIKEIITNHRMRHDIDNLVKERLKAIVDGVK